MMSQQNTIIPPLYTEPENERDQLERERQDKELEREFEEYKKRLQQSRIEKTEE